MDLLETIFRPENITALSTFILAILTAILAWFTKNLAIEAKKTREQNAAPNIVVTIEPSGLSVMHVVLVVENIGKGAAYDVSVKEDSKYAFKDNDKKFTVDDLKFLNPKILKPGQKIQHLLCSFSELPDQVFTFTVEAKNYNDKKFEFLSSAYPYGYLGLCSFEGKGINDLVKHVDKISKNFEHIVTGWRRIKVDSFTNQDRVEEKKLIDKQDEEWRKAQKQ